MRHARPDSPGAVSEEDAEKTLIVGIIPQLVKKYNVFSEFFVKKFFGEQARIDYIIKEELSSNCANGRE
jgi:hypothetical protein